MSQMVKVIAKFLNKKTAKPITGENYLVKLYDNDVVSDDFLGEAKLNSAGEAHITTDLSRVSSPDSPGEKKPDLYFELYNEHGVVYQSRVFANVDFLEEDKITGRKSGLTKDFGAFEV